MRSIQPNCIPCTLAERNKNPNSNGNQVWKASQAPLSELSNVQIGGASLDGANNLYLVSDWFIGSTGDGGYLTYKFTTGGTLAWTTDPEDGNGYNSAHGAVIGSSGNLLLVGQVFHMGKNGCSTVELSTNGSTEWADLYPPDYSGAGAGLGIAIDSANNSYVTGYSPDTNGTNDIVTIKYNPNGNQVWLQRYNAYNVGNAEGNAIAVDKNGNVYVTGYETTAAGGTEIVTIKYAPLVFQRRSDGSFILQAQGSPGESFNIEASQDLQTWLDLGSIFADSNGLAQFTDTNAPNYPARFYTANPQ